ncbi:leukocyte elastase inhibitor-like isoform X3 [Haliotis rufescens]|uniref:leukocyte elastase inhibitor-like isoform X1 n=2 Tax=Haliotis rufescens TaxID=6454 RepID=UPI00201EEBEF|nr:leukocyte elastase inhibitor-like isoform X1 [Haliotis rufescens]XP_048258253.1 leukocyte elastase inhibitor-like isoform X3 [Haliotis rufescens]
MLVRQFLSFQGTRALLLLCHFFYRAMAGSGTGLKSPDLVKQVATANSQFGLDLYKKVASDLKDSNVFLSPFSISAALAMTQLGARGDTAAQMNQVLKWTDLQDSVHPGFEDYLGLLKTQGDYVLTTANRLFVNDKSKILDEFLQKTDKHYGAQAVLSDFVGNGAGEAQKINQWVESETNGKIKDLITGGIDPLTAMILINAIYFKGNWAQKFDPTKTKKDTFKVKPGETIQVDMMRMSKKFNFGYNEELNCSVLELPYVKEELSMFFLLPFKDDGLAELEDKLNHESLTQALKNVHKVTVDISMPRFVLESSFELNNVLKSLGMSDAFDEQKADLSGIDGTRLLYISQVVHKAFLEVNEEGSEAAAATAVRIMTRSLPIIEPFKADHPFLFLIRDTRADVVLFMGRLVRPPTTGSAGGSKKTEL